MKFELVKIIFEQKLPTEFSFLSLNSLLSI